MLAEVDISECVFEIKEGDTVMGELVVVKLASLAVMVCEPEVFSMELKEAVPLMSTGVEGRNACGSLELKTGEPE